MSVISKMKVSQVSKSEYGTEVYMHPVYEDQGVNKAWNEATPGGSVHMHISKGKPAAEQFALGDEFYVAFYKKDELPSDLRAAVESFEKV